MILRNDDWTPPIVAYLKSRTLPEEQKESRWLKVWATHFVLIVDVLYKKGFSRPYIRCLALEEADYVMREVHEGVCGNHSRA